MNVPQQQEKDDVNMVVEGGEQAAQPSKLPEQPHPGDEKMMEENKNTNNNNGRKDRGKNDGPVETPEELLDRFEYISKLGEGTYGVVHMAKELTSNTVVAVKEIKIDHCDDGIPSTAIREIAVLQELRNNQFIVNLKDIIHGLKKNKLFLVFEYFNQDIKKFLDK